MGSFAPIKQSVSGGRVLANAGTGSRIRSSSARYSCSKLGGAIGSECGDCSSLPTLDEWPAHDSDDELNKRSRHLVSALRSEAGGRNCEHDRYEDGIAWRGWRLLRKKNGISSYHTPRWRGLANLGNTCYMNSALQCLAATKLLSEYFTLSLYKPEINRENPLGSGGLLVKAFADFIKKLYSEDAGSLSPRGMKEAISRFAPQFAGFDQHDAQEFLAFLLDGLHEDLNRVQRRKFITEPDIDAAKFKKKSLNRLAAEAWRRYLWRNKSILVDMFQGQFLSRVVCKKCGYTSYKFEPFMYLSLPIKRAVKTSVFRPFSKFANAMSSLEQAVQEFLEPEILEGDEAFRCKRCKEDNPAEKSIKFVQLPLLLIVHLSRFEYKASTTREGHCRLGQFRKLGGLVVAPVEGLSFEKYVHQRDPPIYDLYGVIDHTGRAQYGHYTATCLHNFQWFRFDDVTVTEVSADSVISENNYVLFYQRRDAPLESALLRRQTLNKPEDWPYDLGRLTLEDMRAGSL